MSKQVTTPALHGAGVPPIEQVKRSTRDKTRAPANTLYSPQQVKAPAPVALNLTDGTSAIVTLQNTVQLETLAFRDRLHGLIMSMGETMYRMLIDGSTAAEIADSLINSGLLPKRTGKDGQLEYVLGVSGTLTVAGSRVEISDYRVNATTVNLLATQYRNTFLHGSELSILSKNGEVMSSGVYAELCAFGKQVTGRDPSGDLAALIRTGATTREKLQKDFARLANLSEKIADPKTPAADAEKAKSNHKLLTGSLKKILGVEKPAERTARETDSAKKTIKAAQLKLARDCESRFKCLTGSERTFSAADVAKALDELVDRAVALAHVPSDQQAPNPTKVDALLAGLSNGKGALSESEISAANA